MTNVVNDEEAALNTLLALYREREDLQESYPEVQRGEYARLIRWAVGVTRKQFEDSAYERLRQNREWYYAQSFTPHGTVDPAVAFKTWNRAEESLASVERRIHDGVPVNKLRERAQDYVRTLSSHFSWAMPQKGALILEIGSGVGYIMEAAAQKFDPSRIIGLDIAPAMIEKAEFLSYDGVTIPLEPGSVDYIYSVACLQHIPKPYVYNLFGEMLRVLKPTGAATLHFMSFAVLQLHKDRFSFRTEIAQQLAGAEGHWHHFYTQEELMYVLTYGYDAQRVKIKEKEGSLWVAFAGKR
jgi:SAM-dependent methyltransferase